MSCSQSGAGGPPFSPAVQQDESSLLLRLRRWLPWEWYSIDGSGWCYDADWDRMQRCAEMDVPVGWNGVGAAPAPPWFGVEERGLLVAVLLSGAVLTCDAELTSAPRGPRRVSTGDAATRTSLPRAVRTGGAGRPAFQGPTYWTHWVRVTAIRVPAYAYRTYRAPWPRRCYAFRQWAAARGASGAAAPDMREWLHSPHALPWAWEPSALLAAAGTLGGLLVGFLAPLALPTIRVTFESSG